ncbi:MAG: hypothetical protein ACTS5A_04070 [Candidatus Hodgkinia cicadicola]
MVKKFNPPRVDNFRTEDWRDWRKLILTNCVKCLDVEKGNNKCWRLANNIQTWEIDEVNPILPWEESK